MADTPGNAGDTGEGPAHEPLPTTPTSPPPLASRLAQARDILKDIVTDTQGVIDQARSVTGRPRQVYLAGFIGTCLVFLVAMRGVGKPLDTSLTVALICFIVIALPLLVFGFAVLSFEVRRGLGSHQAAMVAGLGYATSCLGELLASLAAVVAIMYFLSFGRNFFASSTSSLISPVVSLVGGQVPLRLHCPPMSDPFSLP